MASTSPYQNNDYQAVSTYRPYQLPVNDIFKAITAQDRFWEIGAERVKHVYDNAVDLNLVTDDNRNRRDEFLKKAQDQLTKLSSMNLSDPSVQRQGFAVFSPLFKDEDIVGEDYVVKSMSNEMSAALMSRNKDGGKDYNPLSVENIQFEKQLLGTQLNRRDGWKALYNNLSTYTPQTDVAAELKKITDLVKAEETKSDTLSTDEWYKTHREKKGVSKERMLAAIEELGSPQLKNQLRIEGRNAYYKKLAGDPTSVDSYFQALAANLYDSKIQDLSNNKAEIDYQNYMTPDNPDSKTKKDTLSRASAQIQDTINDISLNAKPKYMAEFTNLHDVNNLSSNLSKIEQLWQSSSINHLAPKLAYQSSSVEIEANPVKIAKENNRVAIERINLGYSNLAEDKRHNLATEADAQTGRMLEGLRIQNEKLKNTGTGNDPLFGGGSASGAFPTSNIANMTEADKAALAAEQRTKFLEGNSDETMRQLAITNIMGENAWAGIQQGVAKNATVSETLIQPEVDKAAAFIKAFTDKYGQSEQGLHFSDIEDLKTQMGQWNVSKFKQVMGSISKHDTEFTGDLITKLADENGVQKAAQFRSEINKSTRNDMNQTTAVFNKQPSALGDYARFFDNNGKTPLTDANIAKAYQKAKPATKMYYKYDIRYRGTMQEAVPVQINKDEYMKLKSEGKDVTETELTLNQFAENVRKRTDPIFFEMASTANSNMVTYNAEKDPQKMQKLQRLRNMVPSSDTDSNPDISKVLNFIQDKGDKVQGWNVYTPAGAQTIPQLEIIMDKLSKEEQEQWNELKNVRIPVATADKSMYQKGSSSGDFRFRGAVMAVAPVNNPEKGRISIINQSADMGQVAPYIDIKDVYVMKDDGTKRSITQKDIQSAIEAQFKMPLATLVDTYLDEVNMFLAGYTTKIELANKAYQEKKK